MELVEIPSVTQPPTNATRSEVVARIRSLRPRRRAVLKSLLVAAMASVLTPLDWFYARRAAAAPGPTTEHLGCAPESYDEEPNNWWVDGSSPCWGGFRRGSFPCTGDGFHREGTYSSPDESYVSNRITACVDRNAWRWEGVRCSDAWTETTFGNGERYEAVTIAACPVEAPPPPPPPPDNPPPDDPEPPPSDLLPPGLVPPLPPTGAR